MDQPNLERIERAVAGDSVALKLLLAPLHARLCGLVGRKIPRDLARTIDAEDIVQDTHIDIFRRIGTFELREPDSFERWATTIALNRLRNAIEKHRALKRGGGRRQIEAQQKYQASTIALLDRMAGPGKTPSRVVARDEALQAVESAMKSLPAHYAEALRLVHIEGRSVREAADAMSRTERAVHGLCRRGLQMMREQLESTTNIFEIIG